MSLLSTGTHFPGHGEWHTFWIPCPWSGADFHPVFPFFAGEYRSEDVGDSWVIFREAAHQEYQRTQGQGWGRSYGWGKAYLVSHLAQTQAIAFELKKAPTVLVLTPRALKLYPQSLRMTALLPAWVSLTGESPDGALKPHSHGLDIWSMLRLTHRVLEAWEEGHT